LCHTFDVGFPLAGTVRALFDNLHACNSTTNGDGSGDETPRSGKSEGCSDRIEACRFSRKSRLALVSVVSGSFADTDSPDEPILSWFPPTAVYTSGHPLEIGPEILTFSHFSVRSP
jgi:hypothetical protein